MLISFTKLVLQATEKVKEGISNYNEMQLIKNKKIEIDKMIDNGIIEELNKIYKP